MEKEEWGKHSGLEVETEDDEWKRNSYWIFHVGWKDLDFIINKIKPYFIIQKILKLKYKMFLYYFMISYLLYYLISK